MQVPVFEKGGTILNQSLFKIFLESDSYKIALEYFLYDSMIASVHKVELIFLKYSSVYHKNSDLY